jgi:hypothetical protein
VDDFIMMFMRTFRKNPGRVFNRVEKILSAWQYQAPDDSFYGMTLQEFQNAVAPAREVRERIEALEREAMALIHKRALLDAECHALANGVVFAVRAHPKHGANSPLYRTMGYMCDQDKRPGRPRKTKPQREKSTHHPA